MAGKKIRYYISGHGFGHASRSGEIVQALRRRHPRLALEVVSNAAAWFLAGACGPGVALRRAGWDVGVVQRDSLRMDEGATLRRCRALLRRRDELLAAEARGLRSAGVALVVADVPYLPFAAAAAAGVPAVAVSNFSWDWIYRGLAERAPGLAEIAAGAAADYALGLGILSLPFADGLDAFARREALPLVARRSGASPAATRRRLGVPASARVGLISFGGFGLEEIDLRPLAALRDWVFLLDRTPVALPDNVRVVPAAACPYPDLVAAADAVITKPGYGIVSEALAHGTAVLYVRRGDFREQACLIAGLHRYGCACEIDQGALRAGAWEEGLRRLLELPGAAERLQAGGEVVAADRLAALAEDGRW